MNRPIKFDAIYQPTGEHFTPITINFENEIVTGDFGGKKNTWCFFSLDGKRGDVILRQYTGLKDRNDKEIYEGDVVTWTGSSSYEIMWSHINASFSVTHKIDGVRYFNAYDMDDLHEAEVIGNIYEQPHLLKGDDTDGT